MEDIKLEFQLMKEQLTRIEKLLKDVVKSNEKMDKHVDFIEATWETFKSPLFALKDVVNRYSFLSLGSAAVTPSATESTESRTFLTLNEEYEEWENIV